MKLGHFRRKKKKARRDFSFSHGVRIALDFFSARGRRYYESELIVTHGLGALSTYTWIMESESEPLNEWTTFTTSKLVISLSLEEENQKRVVPTKWKNVNTWRILGGR